MYKEVALHIHNGILLSHKREQWDGEEDGREVQKGGDICIPMADSC